MASDLKIEIFSRYILSDKLIDLKTMQAKTNILPILGEECSKVENCLEVCDMMYAVAVLCRRKIFGKLYLADFSNEEAESLNSLYDCYDYITKTCDRDDLFGHLTVFERMLATSGFVIDFCNLIYEYNTMDVTKYSPMFWAMYFDKFTAEFYAEGGWDQLKEVARSYLNIIGLNSNFDEKEFPILGKAIEDYYDFMDSGQYYEYYENEIELKKNHVSKIWIKYKVEQFESWNETPVIYRHYVTFSEIEELVQNLKCIYDCISKISIFDDMATLETSDEYDNYLKSLNVPEVDSFEEVHSEKSFEVNCSLEIGEQQADIDKRTGIISAKNEIKSKLDGNSQNILIQARSYSNIIGFYSNFGELEFHELGKAIEDYSDFMDSYEYFEYEENKIELKKSRISKIWIKYNLEQFESCTKNPITHRYYVTFSEIKELLQNLKSIFDSISKNFICVDNVETLKTSDDYDDYLENMNAPEVGSFKGVRIEKSSKVNYSLKNEKQQTAIDKRTEITSATNEIKSELEVNSKNISIIARLHSNIIDFHSNFGDLEFHVLGEVIEDYYDFMDSYEYYEYEENKIELKKSRISKIWIKYKVEQFKSCTETPITYRCYVTFSEIDELLQNLKSLYYSISKIPFCIDDVETLKTSDEYDNYFENMNAPEVGKIEGVRIENSFEVKCSLKNEKQQTDIDKRNEIRSASNEIKSELDGNSKNISIIARLHSNIIGFHSNFGDLEFPVLGKAIDDYYDFMDSYEYYEYKENKIEQKKSHISKIWIKYKLEQFESCTKTPITYRYYVTFSEIKELLQNFKILYECISKNPNCDDGDAETLETFDDYDNYLENLDAPEVGSFENLHNEKSVEVNCRLKNEKQQIDINKRTENISAGNEIESELDENSENIPIQQCPESSHSRNIEQPSEMSCIPAGMSSNEMDVSLLHKKSLTHCISEEINCNLEDGGSCEQVHIEKTFEVNFNAEIAETKEIDSAYEMSKSKLKFSPTDILPEVLKPENSHEFTNYEIEKNKKLRESLKNEQEEYDINIFLRMILVLNDRQVTKFVIQALKKNKDGPEKTQSTRKNKNLKYKYIQDRMSKNPMDSRNIS